MKELNQCKVSKLTFYCLINANMANWVYDIYIPQVPSFSVNAYICCDRQFIGVLRN